MDVVYTTKLPASAVASICRLCIQGTLNYQTHWPKIPFDCIILQYFLTLTRNCFSNILLFEGLFSHRSPLLQHCLIAVLHLSQNQLCFSPPTHHDATTSYLSMITPVPVNTITTKTHRQPVTTTTFDSFLSHLHCLQKWKNFASQIS